METIISWHSLFGGILLGISAVSLLYFSGKIAGISGILGGAIFDDNHDRTWRLLFILGMILGGYWGAHYFGGYFPQSITNSIPTLIIAGLLVGAGTKLGNGCTSGHGICGVGRLSPRSIVATIIFVAIAMLTVFITHYIF